MSKVDPKILERIRKMLALAEDNANIHESATAAAMAEKLMRKYQLERADFMLHDTKVDDVEGIGYNHGSNRWGPKYASKTVPTWINHIATGCGRANECECVVRGGTFVFFGVAGDASVAAEMLHYLVTEVERLAMFFHGGRTEKNNFRNGCAYVLQDRLEEIGAERVKEFQQTSAGTALVVMKKDLIEQSTGREFKYTKGKPKIADPSAFIEGMAAGAAIPLRKMVENENG